MPKEQWSMSLCRAGADFVGNRAYYVLTGLRFAPAIPILSHCFIGDPGRIRTCDPQIRKLEIRLGTVATRWRLPPG